MIFLDFEFNQTLSPLVNLVCAVTYYIPDFDPSKHDMAYVKKHADKKRWWLHNSPGIQEELKHYLNCHKYTVYCGYQCIAESRAFMSLDFNPVEFTWIDMFLEYRCLTNHNDALLWGEQLKDGVVKVTKKPPPKWERTEQDSKNSFKPTHSLSEATFKLTGQIRDTKEKDEIRDLIISAPDEFTSEQKKKILDYCELDTEFLPEILIREVREYKKLGFLYNETMKKEMYLRGKYSALTAKMESYGYPINYEKTKNFSNSVGPIIDECQREINKLFPEIKPFKWNRKEGKFSWNQSATCDWLSKNVDVKKWMKTDGFFKAKKQFTKDVRAGLNPPEVKHEDYLSLSLDAFTQVFDFKHHYPKDNFGAQMVRYLKLKQNMNGFVPNPKKRSFWDSVGPDQRVRPYFNPYGSQSSRSQPGSTSFLFLKPAWMRALCEPPPGKAIASFDYGSEEFLIAALLSRCKNMVDAYDSGDVYLAFAKMSGMVPKDATKESHPEERQLAKQLVLAMSYLMSAVGLAAKITLETGKKCTEDQAQEYIDAFYETFYELGLSQQEVQEVYAEVGYLKLKCGWAMWGDNPNHRSVVNLPVQGLGASIMRKAVEFADAVGLKVIITLHDALYIEYDIGDYGAIDKLYKAMHDAFVFYFDDKKSASIIRLDGFSWSPEFPAPKIVENAKGKKEKQFATIITPGGMEIDIANLYIDDRAQVEYDTFSKYFDRGAESYL